MFKKAFAYVIGLAASALSLFTPAAHAAAIDVTAITADIAAQAAPIALVASAVLMLMLGLKTFKWVRRAMS